MLSSSEDKELNGPAVGLEADASEQSNHVVKRASFRASRPRQPAYLPYYKVKTEARAVFRNHVSPAVQNIKGVLKQIDGSRYLIRSQKDDFSEDVQKILDHLLINVVNLLKPYLNQKQGYRVSFPRKVVKEIRALVPLVEELEREAKDILQDANQINRANRDKYAEEPPTVKIQQKAAHVLDDFFGLKLKIRDAMHFIENEDMIEEDQRTILLDELQEVVSPSDEQRIKDLLKPVARSQKFGILYPLGTMEDILAIESEVEDWEEEVDDIQAEVMDTGRDKLDRSKWFTPMRRHRRSVFTEDSESSKWRGVSPDDILDMLTARMKQVYSDLVQTKKTILDIAKATEVEDLNDELNNVHNTLRVEFKDRYKYFKVNRHCTDEEDLQMMFDTLDRAESQFDEIQEDLEERIKAVETPSISKPVPETLPLGIRKWKTPVSPVRHSFEEEVQTDGDSSSFKKITRGQWFQIDDPRSPSGQFTNVIEPVHPEGRPLGPIARDGYIQIDGDRPTRQGSNVVRKLINPNPHLGQITRGGRIKIDDGMPMGHSTSGNRKIIYPETQSGQITKGGVDNPRKPLDQKRKNSETSVRSSFKGETVKEFSGRKSESAVPLANSVMENSFQKFARGEWVQGDDAKRPLTPRPKSRPVFPIKLLENGGAKEGLKGIDRNPVESTRNTVQGSSNDQRIIVTIMQLIKGRMAELQSMLGTLRQTISDGMTKGDISLEEGRIFQHRIKTVFSLLNKDVMVHLRDFDLIQGRNTEGTMTMIESLGRVLDDLTQEATSIRTDVLAAASQKKRNIGSGTMQKT